MSKSKTPADIIADLAEKAYYLRAMDSPHPHANRVKPGTIIKELGPVKRQVLKSLKSEDIENIRWEK